MAARGPRIRAVLFDLGGTLVDYRDFLGWTELARQAGVELYPDELRHAFQEVEAARDQGPFAPEPTADFHEYWRRVLARASGTEVPTEAAERFLAAYDAVAEHPMALYSDVRRCLDQLRAEGRRLGVVSNSRSEAAVRRILERVGILSYFERVVSSGTEGVAKPDPEIFRRALTRLELSPTEALYVGDLPRTDALGAAGAGLYGLWLNREGTGFEEGPPEITSLLELPLVVRQLEGPAVGGSARP